MSIKLEYIELLFKELNESQIQKFKTKYIFLENMSDEDMKLCFKYANDNINIKEGILLGNIILILEHCFPNGKDENGNPKFLDKYSDIEFVMNTDLTEILYRNNMLYKN